APPHLDGRGYQPSAVHRGAGDSSHHCVVALPADEPAFRPGLRIEVVMRFHAGREAHSGGYRSKVEHRVEVDPLATVHGPRRAAVRLFDAGREQLRFERTKVRADHRGAPEPALPGGRGTGEG